jgi:hypothetical protein
MTAEGTVEAPTCFSQNEQFKVNFNFNLGLY